MDIISYGAASKVSKEESYTRNDVLGQGVEGSYSNVKSRVDHLEKAIQGVVEQADNLIIKDTINIMKAHAKLNAIAKTKKYNMHNMVFDDLLDLSGIDGTKSYGYIHDSDIGSIEAPESSNPWFLNYQANEDPLSVGFQIVSNSYTPDIEMTNDNTIIIKNNENAITITQSGIRYFHNFRFTEPQLYTFRFKIIGENDRLRIWSRNGQSVRVDINYHEVERSHNSIYGELNQGDWNEVSIRYTDHYTGHIKINNSDWIKMTSFSAASGGDLVITVLGSVEIDYIKMDNSHDPSDDTELAIIETLTEEVDFIPSKAIISAEKEGNIKYWISRDSGSTWEAITSDVLFYFNDGISPIDNKIKLKIELLNGAKLLNYALTWA